MKKVGLVILGVVIGLAIAGAIYFFISYRDMQAKLENYEQMEEQKPDNSTVDNSSHVEPSDTTPSPEAEVSPMPSVEVLYPYEATYTGKDYLDDYMVANEKATRAASGGGDYDEAFNAYFEGKPDAQEYLRHRPTNPDLSSLPSNHCGIWICIFDEDSYGNVIDGVGHKISTDNGETFIELDPTGTWVDMNTTTDVVFSSVLRSAENTFVGRLEASTAYTASSTMWCFDQQLPNGVTVYWRITFYS